MEEPNLSQLEAPLRAMVNIPATRQLYYLIGRENLIISRKTDFPAYLYRLMAGTSRPVGEYLHIPPGQTIEIGTSINI
jgi:K+ transporter